MNKSLWGAMAVLLGGLVAANQAEARQIRLSDSTLTIAVKNYARVDAETLDQAEATATIIFQKAGVRVQWIDLTSPGTGGQVLTNGPLFDVQVHIIGGGLSERLNQPDNVMGMAPGGGEDRQLVYVFYDRAEALVSRQKIARMEGRVTRYPSRSQMLGDLMAHELGHVLLNRRSHSTTGIMRGQWDLRDLEDGSRWLLFTGPQAEIIRTEVARRVRQRETVDVAEQLGIP